MSKESKPRDRARQSIEAVRDRPVDYCRGCGYYLAANGHHRADCTATNQEAPSGARDR